MTAAQLITEYKFVDRGSHQATVAAGRLRGLARASDEVSRKGGTLSNVWTSFGGGGGAGVPNMLDGLSSGVAAGGGLFTRAITAPISAVTNAVNNLGDTLAKSIPVFGLLAALILRAVMQPLELLNAQLAFLGRALEFVVGAGGVAARVLLQVGGLLVGALATIGGLAIRVATQFDTMTRSLGALLGSMEAGQQAARFIEQYGMKSAFDQGPLLEAARTIVAANLSMSRWLPVLERLALLRGPEPENMMDVASIFRRIIGGQIAEGFGPEGLGRMGINRGMLEEFGARFDNQGGFLGSVADALLVLERLASSPKFTALSEMMESGPAVMFSNAMDAINKALRELGYSILPRITPFILEFVNVINEISNSGVLRQLGEELMTAFGIGGGTTLEMFRGVLYTVAATLVKLPALVTTLIEVGKQGFTMWLSLVESLLNMIIKRINVAIHLMNALRGAFSPMIPAIPTIPNANFGEMLNAGRDKFWVSDNPLARWLESVTSTKQELMAGAGKGGPGEATDPTAAFGIEHLGVLGRIAQNTAETARNTKMEVDLRKMAFGGGQTGRLGVTAVEMNQIRREVRLRVDKTGFRGLQLAMLEMFEEFLAQAERAGALRR